MISASRPLGTTRPRLGLDELRNVVQMISPEYPCLLHEGELRYFGLEPILSKEDYTALCSLSLSCRALREGCQRALMRYISIEEKDLRKLLDFLGARYQDKFPIRKLTIFARETIYSSDNYIYSSTPKKLVDMLIRSPELEFLCIDCVALPQNAFHCYPVTSIHFDRLVTFCYICPWNRLYDSGFFGTIIATMPQLKNLSIRATEDPPRVPVCQLEILMLNRFSYPQNVSQWIISNSFESLHTLQLSWLCDTPDLMDALVALLENSGLRLRTLHIWGADFKPQSIVSLIHACPNLQEIGIPLFDSQEVYPVPDAVGAEPGLQNLAAPLQAVEPTLTCANVLIINALCAPILRLHIIWESWLGRHGSPPTDAFRLPTLCRALKRDHEKLAKLELILLVAMIPGEVSTPNFNIDTNQGIVAVCKERGLRLRCSTQTNTTEWGEE